MNSSRLECLFALSCWSKRFTLGSVITLRLLKFVIGFWVFLEFVLPSFAGCHPVLTKLQNDGYSYNAFIYSIDPSMPIREFKFISDCSSSLQTGYTTYTIVGLIIVWH